MTKHKFQFHEKLKYIIASYIFLDWFNNRTTLEIALVTKFML